MSPDDHDPGRESVRRDVERTEAVEGIIREFEASLVEPKVGVVLAAPGEVVGEAKLADARAQPPDQYASILNLEG